jgi:hypothetical protein
MVPAVYELRRTLKQNDCAVFRSVFGLHASLSIRLEAAITMLASMICSLDTQAPGMIYVQEKHYMVGGLTL